jgi:hypothetical protein
MRRKSKVVRRTLRYADKFRDYQKRAVAMVRRYRNAYVGKSTTGAALVCHPTGTGKTAVMAALAHASPEIGSVIVLTTREAVRDQLVRELSGNLFIEPDKFNLSERIELPKATFVVQYGPGIGAPVADAKRSTLSLLSGRLLAFATSQLDRHAPDSKVTTLSLFKQGRAILVMTVQMLDSIRNQSADIYIELSKHADLVIFDEGHYEPAAQWSVVVRDLKCPLALLSATPFRNDLKPFQVDSQNIDIYKYKQATLESRVRPVTVVSRKTAAEAEVFCEDVFNFCVEKFGSDRATWPRVIIHCDQSSRITRLGDEFVQRKFSVIGIHDTFPDKHSPRNWQYQKVPPPRETDAQIWIHQYKLMEGIDDHRFRVLALFDPMTNVRWVVQQIGRIIRLSPGSRATDEPAFVLDHFRGRVAEYWSLYEDYDESLSNDYLAQSLTKFYLEKFIQAHPPVDYFDRKFRRRLVIDEVKNPVDEILFDRRVILKQLDPNYDVTKLGELMEEQFTLRDLRYSKCLSTKNELIYLYVGLVNPPFLQSKFFAEVRHGARILILLPEYEVLAIADTDGESSGTFLGFMPSPEARRMERLLAPGRYGRISQISSRNTSLGNRVIRRRTVSAPSIANTPPILDEHGHVLSAIAGYNGDRSRIVDDTAYLEAEVDLNFADHARVPDISGAQPENSEPVLLRRYVGLANGRVSETGPSLRFRAFVRWVQSLAEQMEVGRPTPGIFHRYARPARHKVTDAIARNLLLDLFEIEDEYIHAKTRDPLQSDDLCIERKGNGIDGAEESIAQFEIRLNDETHPLEVVFRKHSQRYRIESSGLDRTFIPRDGANRVTLSRKLNELQAFNIIPDDLSVIYVHGRFYAPGLKFGDRFDRDSFFVGQSLYPSPVLKALTEEKGRHVLRANGTRTTSDEGVKYDAESVFGLIDSWCSGFDTGDLDIPDAWMNEYAPEAFEFKPTLVICDDMSKESADFILADEKRRRVAIVHAKASSKWKPYSASAVQEVCAQAQKNTALLAMFSLRTPELRKWDRVHRFTGANKLSLSIQRRIRKPSNIDSHEAWRRLKPLLQNPLTMREVWIVLGNMLSANELAENLQSSDPDPETLQLNHLLQTTIASIGAAGAKVRIFCAP